MSGFLRNVNFIPVIALGCALLALPAMAATVGFSQAEGYIAGALAGQPGSGSVWSVTQNNSSTLFRVYQGASVDHPDHLQVNLSTVHGPSSELTTVDYASKRMAAVTGAFTAGFSFCSSLSADNIGDETCIALGESASGGWGVYLGFDKSATGSIDYHNGSEWVQISTGVAEREWYNIEIAGDVAAGLFDLAIYREDQRDAGEPDSGLLIAVEDLSFRDSPAALSYVVISNEGSSKDTGGYYHFYDDLSLVPEPCAMTLLACGAAALLRRRRH